MNRWLKWGLRLGLSGLAIYFIFRKISWQETKGIILSSNIAWLLVALFFYNISQFLSTWRLLYFYRALDIPLSFKTNLELYYKGMFYNLFLPGGIGGDGYKIHYLYKKYHQPVKKLVTATLLDRVSGLTAVGFFIALFAVSGIWPEELKQFSPYWLVVAFVVGMAVAWGILRFFFNTYKSAGLPATLLSIGVQAMQLIAVWCIIEALHIEGGLLAYFLLFLLSSIAAIVPFTIGGAGAREIVFMTGAPLFGVLPANAVAVSLLFFLLTVISSFVGVGVEVKNDVQVDGNLLQE